MPYATLDDVEAYGVRIDDPDQAQALLERCQRELDTVLRSNTFQWMAEDVKIITDYLTGFQTRRLMLATCAQFEYHIAMGEDFFLRPQPRSVRQPEGGGYDGTLPIIAPRAIRELEGTDLLRVSGSVDSAPDDVRGDPFFWQRSWTNLTYRGGLR